MSANNWPDDRLDDLDEEVSTQGEAITFLSLKVNTLEADMRHLREANASKATKGLAWWGILATASNSLTALVTYFISRGK